MSGTRQPTVGSSRDFSSADRNFVSEHGGAGGETEKIGCANDAIRWQDYGVRDNIIFSPVFIKKKNNQQTTKQKTVHKYLVLGRDGASKEKRKPD